MTNANILFSCTLSQTYIYLHLLSAIKSLVIVVGHDILDLSEGVRVRNVCGVLHCVVLYCIVSDYKKKFKISQYNECQVQIKVTFRNRLCFHHYLFYMRMLCHAIKFCTPFSISK